MTSENDKQLLLLIGKNLQKELIFQTYDLEGDEWYAEKKLFDNDMSENITMAFCVIGSKLYFPMKIEPEKNEMNLENSESSSEMQIFGFGFFPEEDRTKYEICNFDLVSNEITHTGATFKCAMSVKFIPVNDKIYFLAANECKLWCYDTKENEIEVCANVGELYFDDCISSANGIIYLLGERMVFRNGPGEKYNPETKELGEMPPPPAVYSYRTAEDRIIKNTELNGKLYAVNQDSLARIFVYTPEDEKWQTITAKNDPLFSRGTLTSCNGQLIAVCSRCYIYVYDFDADKWNCIRDYNGSMIINYNAIPVFKSMLSDFLI